MLLRADELGAGHVVRFREYEMTVIICTYHHDRSVAVVVGMTPPRKDPPEKYMVVRCPRHAMLEVTGTAEVAREVFEFAAEELEQWFPGG